MSSVVAVALMCKNEEKRIGVTLESVRDFANKIIIYDTGSEDNTVKICQEFAKETKIPLFIIHGTFIDFSTSRNKLLDYVDTFKDIDFVLLLDVNDELRGASKLRSFLENDLPKMGNDISSAFLVPQEWWSGILQRYYNLRLIRPRDGWRYVSPVHEFLQNPDKVKDKKLHIQLNVDGVCIYQDRTLDDDKSFIRFSRDKVILQQEYEKDSNNGRTIFYLAQTLICLREFEEAEKMYRKRLEVKIENDFIEEKFESMVAIGRILQEVNKDWYDSFTWFIKAYELMPRAEPILSICEYYLIRNNLGLAYAFATLACKLEFPAHCVLFVDRLIYDYKRWHLLGIIGYHVGAFQEGKHACTMAIEGAKKHNINPSVDSMNLHQYVLKLDEKQ